MGNPNWAVLVQQGRAKGIGVPWSTDELKAIHELKIPVEFVRRGAITKKGFEKLQEADATPIESLSKKELLERAKGTEARITNDEGKKEETPKEDTPKEAPKKNPSRANKK